MTLDQTNINQKVRITRIHDSHENTSTSLKEMGLFCGECIFKLRENKGRCGIFCIHGCNRIMLDNKFSSLIEVEDEKDHLS